MLSTVIFNEDDAKKYLYHYTTIEKLLLYILPQKELKFSNIRYTNDPYESYERGFHMCDDLNLMEREREIYMKVFLENQKKFADTLRNEIRIICCSKDALPQTYDVIRNSGRGFLKPRMWAQYANNNKGVCLVLNKNKLIKQFENNFKDTFHISKDIVYEFNYEMIERSYNAYTFNTSELKDSTFEQVVENKIINFSDIYYFSKHPDWKEENEYRFLVRADSGADLTLKLDGILESIILGIEAEEILSKSIDIMLNKFNELPIIYKLYYINQQYYLFPVEKSKF